MTQVSILLFADLQIDIANAQVWRGSQALKLTPTAFALLRHLVEHAGQLVTKEELLQALWPETAVTEGVLTTHVGQLRQALGDEAKAPQFIETVHRRGYRWIAETRGWRLEAGSSSPQVSSLKSLASNFVGREAERQQLHDWLDKALNGDRQLLFVTGEPGIGKTTLVEAFLARFTTAPEHEHDHGLRIGRGQCIEHYGTGEPYLPVLEALGRLCREPDGQRLLEILSQYAPTWLVQMPALLSATELEALQRQVAGVTKERMLRELAEAVEVLTAERGLVLWLEDVQWSDVSTLDWLAVVARRREPAQVLILGTYRPVDVIVGNHPLKAVKHELQVHGQCTELPLGFLRKDDIEDYLAKRFVAPSPVSTGEACPERSRRGWGESLAPVTLHKLAHLIHRRTDGNPLFMVNVIAYLVAQGVLVQSEGHWTVAGAVTATEAGVPASLQQLIEQQLERLGAKDQRVLEVASVVGAEFSAAAVAAGVATEIEEVEEQCEELARREQFLWASETAEWPDRTVAARYRFRHALYQEVLYSRLTARRRHRLHQQIGEREEQGYGERAREIAAELALHFERGREYRKAVQYLQHAGENALQRSAYQEAISLLTKGLELLKLLPDTPERIQQELRLQIVLGSSLMITKGFTVPEVEQVYSRALELGRQVGEMSQLFLALRGLWQFYTTRGESQRARELGEQLLALARRQHDPALLLQGSKALAENLFWLGELASARAHLEQGLTFYDPQQHRSLAFLFVGEDLRIGCLGFAALALWSLGYPDQALKRGDETVTLAWELSHPYSQGVALFFAAMIHQLRREGQAAQEQAEAMIVLCSEQGFPFGLAWGTILWGWGLAAEGQGEEGIAQIRQGLVSVRAMKSEVARPYYLALLAEAYGKVGQTEKGLSVLAEALEAVNKTGTRWYEAELLVD
jgi:DNA-binding winged helix-turn-helix (wHTH) protein/predicted ATPase